VELLWNADDPRAEWFEQHLRQFSEGGAGQEQAGAVPIDPDAAVWFFAGAVEAALTLGRQREADQEGVPNPLGLALVPSKRMGEFVAQKFRAVDDAELGRRVAQCRSCQHFTGLRCRLAACFAEVRAKLRHERCPIGRWSGIEGN
jgi:hypothetical protein